MLLRVAGHTVIKRLARFLDGRAVGKEALVKALYLFHQLSGVRMSARGRYKSAVLLGFVAS